MTILSKADALGALCLTGIGIELFRNDGTTDLKFDFVATGPATISVNGDNLEITVGMNSQCSITLSDTGTNVLKPGGLITLKKATPVGTYTPVLIQDWSDPVFMKEVATNANVVLARKLSYWVQATMLTGLGLTNALGIAANAKVDLEKDAIDAISEAIDIGTLNIIG